MIGRRLLLGLPLAIAALVAATPADAQPNRNLQCPHGQWLRPNFYTTWPHNTNFLLEDRALAGPGGRLNPNVFGLGCHGESGGHLGWDNPNGTYTTASNQFTRRFCSQPGVMNNSNAGFLFACRGANPGPCGNMSNTSIAWFASRTGMPVTGATEYLAVSQNGHLTVTGYDNNGVRNARCGNLDSFITAIPYRNRNDGTCNPRDCEFVVTPADRLRIFGQLTGNTGPGNCTHLEPGARPPWWRPTGPFDGNQVWSGAQGMGQFGPIAAGGGLLTADGIYRCANDDPRGVPEATAGTFMLTAGGSCALYSGGTFMTGLGYAGAGGTLTAGGTALGAVALPATACVAVGTGAYCGTRYVDNASGGRISDSVATALCFYADTQANVLYRWWMPGCSCNYDLTRTSASMYGENDPRCQLRGPPRGGGCGGNIANPNVDPPYEEGADEDAGGCATGGASGSGAMLVVAAMLAARRRRRVRAGVR